MPEPDDNDLDTTGTDDSINLSVKNQDVSKKIDIIEMVKSPLGLFTVIILVLETILLALTSADTNALILGLIILGMSVILIAVIVFVKPEVFYPPSEWSELRDLRKESKEVKTFQIYLRFPPPQKATPPTLPEHYDNAKCYYSIYFEGKLLKKNVNASIQSTSIDGRYSPFIRITIPKKAINQVFRIFMEYNQGKWYSDSFETTKGQVNLL